MTCRSRIRIHRYKFKKAEPHEDGSCHKQPRVFVSLNPMNFFISFMRGFPFRVRSTHAKLADRRAQVAEHASGRSEASYS
jgi:hypothetical protein